MVLTPASTAADSPPRLDHHFHGPVSGPRFCIKAPGPIVVEAVSSRRASRAWLEWPLEHYAADRWYVPPLLLDERSIFSARNPVRAVARSRRFLAKRDDRIVGRICGIIHDGEGRKLGYRRGRFGWFESVEDQDVANALLDAVREWLLAGGCEEMTGPHGFTDLDPEGLLVEGFDELPTIAASYHPRYYATLLEAYGMRATRDYVEYRITLPVSEPTLFRRLRERETRSPYRVFSCRSRAELMRYAPGFWEALEESFEPLYGVTPLLPAQQEYYTRRYLGMLDPTFVHLAVDGRDDVVGFFITMPNLSRAFQKAAGRLLPFGFLHIWRGMRRPDTVDLLLAGVRAGHSSALISGLLAVRVLEMCHRRGIRYVETNRELETNTSVVSVWRHFDARLHRRSRMYRLPLQLSSATREGP
jgi:hypothetical protein